MPASCPFCNLLAEPPSARLISFNEQAFAIYDKYPVLPGHALVIPIRHVANYFDLTPAERAGCWELVETVKARLEEKHQPDGYNLGVNVGPAAGQTVWHVHIHVIPRYKGDVEDPRGGVRHVIPGKGPY